MNEELISGNLAIALVDIEYNISDYKETCGSDNENHRCSFSISFTGFGVALITTELLTSSLLVNITYTSKSYKTVSDKRLFDVSEQGLSNFTAQLRQFLLTAKIGGDVRE